MCIDYTDLNKAISKKPFPFPWIDQIVDAVAGHAVFCFLDTYKGYHHIQMDDEDMGKTALVTNDNTFCYTRMSFRLKNTEAES